MSNCLSNAIFENLLFVNVNACGKNGIALFDTGAQKTLICERFIKKCNCRSLIKNIKVGNNNGQTLSLKTANIDFIKIGDKEVTNLDVLVCPDNMINMKDTQGHKFPADILLGYDVISKFKWSYFPATNSLNIECPDINRNTPNLYYNVFPIINVEHGGKSYRAGIDTGHTETIIKSTVNIQNLTVNCMDDKIVGVGSIKNIHVPVISEIKISFENTDVILRNITVQEEICGASDGTDILLGMDFFADRSWELDFSEGIFKVIT
jgi:predicted aspartyl protease